MTRPEFVRRRQAGVLLVGATEPEVGSWLRAAGHATRAVPGADAALAALGEEPADLVIADREPGGGLDAPGVCVALRGDPRLGSSWLLAITASARGGAADVGADDYLHRPFTRLQLLARTRTGLRAVQQRSDDALLRSLMATVPGAVYRSAWHAQYRIELITDEIERISGYPADNFIASTRRTLMSIIHPDDSDAVMRAVATASDERPFGLEYRIVRADGEVRWVLDRGQLVAGAGGRLWMDGVIFDITERRAAEEALRRREIEAARTAELQASRARIVAAADAARRRIERDLHDGAQQRLVALALDVQVARARVETDPGSAGPFLDRLVEELSATSAELRELARGIHPAVLTQRGLGAAIQALAGRAPVPVEVLGAPSGRLSPTLETTAYFTVAESLTNVAKYARASHATVRVAEEDGALVIEVRDDGVGGARPALGSGLTGLADRVGACDGTLSVVSPPGEGTLVRAELPLPA
ncbi:MAG TPA: PAS domain-containing protein [Solirubrobacteraceae bacterium]|nr:PAS domain-containing protein [Solirubrobacteraceae bacterium]